MTQNSTVRTLGVLLAGVGAGAAAALLYAPQSGKQTRKHLRKYVNRKVDQFEDLQGSVTSFMNEHAAGLKNSMADCIGDAKGAFDDTRSSLVEALSGIQHRFDDGVARFAKCVRTASR